MSHCLLKESISDMSANNDIPQDFTPQDLIPKPCHEDWQKMTGDEKRRHCAKCNTHVEDLTGKSAKEILALREKNGGKLCGAFRLAPAIGKPLALGSGIASLALASCQTKEPPLVGKICAPPEKETSQKSTHKSGTSASHETVKKSEEEVIVEIEPVKPKPAEVEEPLMLLGDICVPPPRPGKGPF